MISTEEQSLFFNNDQENQNPHSNRSHEFRRRISNSENRNSVNAVTEVSEAMEGVLLTPPSQSRTPLRQLTLGLTDHPIQYSQRMSVPSPLSQPTYRRTTLNENAPLLMNQNHLNSTLSPRPQMARPSIWCEWDEKQNKDNASDKNSNNSTISSELGPITSTPNIPQQAITQSELLQYNWMRDSTQPTARRLFTSPKTPSLRPRRPGSTAAAIPGSTSQSPSLLQHSKGTRSPTVVNTSTPNRSPHNFRGTMLRFPPINNTEEIQIDEVEENETFANDMFKTRVEIEHRTNIIAGFHKTHNDQQNEQTSHEVIPVSSSSKRRTLLQSKQHSPRSPRNLLASPKNEHRRTLLLDVIAAEDHLQTLAVTRLQ